ncbi:MAG: hypothetical protein AAB281_04365, partial [Actinomycetota bacterium]
MNQLGSGDTPICQSGLKVGQASSFGSEQRSLVPKKHVLQETDDATWWSLLKAAPSFTATL